jgi:hypothetical protein
MLQSRVLMRSGGSVLPDRILLDYPLTRLRHKNGQLLERVRNLEKDVLQLAAGRTSYRRSARRFPRRVSYRARD